MSEYQDKIAVAPVKLGKRGIKKQIFVGVRLTDKQVDFIADFIRLARTEPAANHSGGVRNPARKRR